MSSFAAPKPLKRRTPATISNEPAAEPQGSCGRYRNDTYYSSPSRIVQEKTNTHGKRISNDRGKLSNLYDIKTHYSSSSVFQSSSSSGPQLDYTPPEWVGIPEDEFSLLVLKEGVVCEETELVDRPYWVVGRVPGCHVVALHPVSYTIGNTPANPPRKHIELRPGDHIRFGESTRTHILQGPDIRERLREEAAARAEQQRQQAQQPIESTGVTWGFFDDVTDDGAIIRAAMEGGEMADGLPGSASGISKRASYEDDPKKALRQYMEHRGYSMEFEMDDEFAHGFHTFTARIKLPIHDEDGASVWASGSAGRKKEAERAASLDAMEKLDAHGELHAKHDPYAAQKRRFKRVLQENDEPDSDDDTFYDRTGAREKRKAKQARTKQAPVENYASLLEKRQQTEQQIEKLTKQLDQISSRTTSVKSKSDDGDDDLDAYMADVQSSINEKEKNKLYKDIEALKEEIKRLDPLIEFTRPNDLPLTAAKDTETVADNNNAINTKHTKEDNQNTTEKLPESTSNNTTSLMIESPDTTKITQSTKPITIAKVEKARPTTLAPVPSPPPPPPPPQPSHSVTAKVKQDETMEDDNTVEWIPPKNQSGDGRTSLNDKYGY
ncbi:hypothetical protein BDF22DRAFT_743828 [Syncephalis plumigaleata]|nr:hypothetical protein BDF22DRAFT_743828 [Syncephalis plumigaleata]